MTETEIERLVVRLVGDSSSYTSMFNGAIATANSANNQISAATIAMGTAIGNIASTAIGAVTNMMRSGVQWGFQLASEAEQAQISFGVMLGSAEKAAKMVNDIRSFAAKTPLETRDLSQAAKTLLQFGVAGENVLPIMRMLGDVTGGDSQRFSMMALSFGQMSSAGRLMGQDLNQMINAGFNPLQEMSKMTGVSMGVLKDRMEKGQISVKMVTDAMQSATKEGGSFAGMMDKQSQSMQGLMSTLKDNAGMIMMQVANKISEAFDFKGILQRSIEFLGTFSDNFEANFTSIATWAKAKWMDIYNGFKDRFMNIADSLKPTIELFKKWFGDTGELAKEFFVNFDIYWEMAQQTIVMWSSNAILLMGDFFANSKNFLTWFVLAWDASFKDTLNAAGTFFKNLVNGQKGAVALMQDIMAGRAISDLMMGNFDNLADAMDGFESTIMEMPDIVKTALAESTPELDALNKKLAERLANPFQFDLPKLIFDAAKDTKDGFANGITGMADPLLKETNKLKQLDAVGINSAEALSRILEFRQGLVLKTNMAQQAAKAPALSPDEQYRQIGQQYRQNTESPAQDKLAMIADYMKTLVDIGKKQLGQPTIELNPAEVA